MEEIIKAFFDDSYLDIFGDYGILYQTKDGCLNSHEDFYEFSVVSTGSFNDYFGDEYIPMKKNTGAFFTPHTMHKQVLLEDKSVLINFFIRKSFFEPFCKSKYPQVFELIQKPTRIAFSIENAALTYFNELTHNIKDKSVSKENTDKYFEIMLNMMMLSCFVEKNTSLIEPNYLYYADDLIHHFDNYDFLDAPLNLVLKNFPISITTMSSAFQQKTGKTMVEYRNEKRMEKAALLLLRWDYSITDIANTVGISSVSYFSKQFKEYYGMVPKDYRKKYSLL